MDKNKTNMRDTKIWFDFRKTRRFLRMCIKITEKRDNETEKFFLMPHPVQAHEKSNQFQKSWLQFNVRVYDDSFFSLFLLSWWCDGNQVLQLRCSACMIRLICFIAACDTRSIFQWTLRFFFSRKMAIIMREHKL